MITLTNPHAVNSVLGGNQLINYDKVVVGPYTMDGVAQTVTATLRLTATTAPTMQPILGKLVIIVPAAEVIVEVAQMDFYRRIAMTPGQATAVLNIIEAGQAQLENGLLSLGTVAGTRAAGV